MTYQSFFSFRFCKVLYLLLLSSVLLGWGCGNDDDDTSDDTISMTLDGKYYGDDKAGAIYSHLLNNHNVTILASFPQPGEAPPYSTTFGLDITKTQTPPVAGNYETIDNQWDGVETYVAAAFNDDFNKPKYESAVQGTEVKVNLTTADIRPGGRVAGTFSAKLIRETTGESVTITNGKFDLPLPQ